LFSQPGGVSLSSDALVAYAEVVAMSEDKKDDVGSERNSMEDAYEEMGIVREFWEFLCENKKFWLIPILIVLGVLALILFASPALSPFVYALF
jgi:hypothetical protein